MEKEWNFERGCLVLIAFVVACVSGCTAFVNANDNQAIDALVAKGSDVQAARCAVHPGDHDSACVLLASKK